ncbi:MAG: YpmS family protein [Atopostipes sp.]|nr:YpmS family protein [Atopostipes sp.]
MEQRSKKNKEKKKEINKWKWAFLSLITILLALVFYFISLLGSSSIEKAQEEEPNLTEEIEIKSGITKEDAEFVLNSYLDTQTDEGKNTYQVEIDDRIKLSAQIKMTALKVPMTLVFEPYATEKGNLQLRLESMDLASLSLPVNLLLSILANQMDLPDYIQIDSEEEMILVDFNELKNYYPYGIKLERVNLENNDIQLKLYVNKDTLKRALDFEKESQSSSEEDIES